MEQSSSKAHKLNMINRKLLNITGVNDVIAFDMNEVLLETAQGMLLIKGKDLKVDKIQLETGDVDVNGQVDSLTYSEVSSYAKKGKSIIQRMFK